MIKFGYFVNVPKKFFRLGVLDTLYVSDSEKNYYVLITLNDDDSITSTALKFYPNYISNSLESQLKSSSQKYEIVAELPKKYRSYKNKIISAVFEIEITI